jgi:hypothetical protein
MASLVEIGPWQWGQRRANQSCPMGLVASAEVEDGKTFSAQANATTVLASELGPGAAIVVVFAQRLMGTVLGGFQLLKLFRENCNWIPKIKIYISEIYF